MDIAERSFLEEESESVATERLPCARRLSKDNNEPANAETKGIPDFTDGHSIATAQPSPWKFNGHRQ